MPSATAALVELEETRFELEETRFELLQYRSEKPQHLKESRDDVEESSQHLKELVAVLSVFRNDGFGFLAVVFRSRDDLEESKSWGKLSRDGRPSSVATMAKSFPYRSGLGADRFALESSLKRLLQVV